MIDEYTELAENLSKRQIQVSENLYNEIKRVHKEMVENEKNKVQGQLKKRVTVIMASEVVLERAKNV